MHCRKTIPSLTMMTRFNFSLPKEPYYNSFTSVWWCVMQSQRSHQQLPAANIPFLLRRLPCEEVELMLQRHRRRPWCMWSGCQRPHFLLSGLKWIGQTQILAQPVVDIPLWAFVGRITRQPGSQCLKCLLGRLDRCQPGPKRLIEQ